MACSPTLLTQLLAIQAYTAQLNDFEIATRPNREGYWSTYWALFKTLFINLNTLSTKVPESMKKDVKGLKRRLIQVQKGFADQCVCRLKKHVLSFVQFSYHFDPIYFEGEYENVNCEKDQLQREIDLLSDYNAPLLRGKLKSIAKCFSQAVVAINGKLAGVGLQLDTTVQPSGENWLFSKKTQSVCTCFFSSQIDDLKCDVILDSRISPYLQRMENLRTELNQQISHSSKQYRQYLQRMHERLVQIRMNLYTRRIAFITNGLNDIEKNFDQLKHQKTLTRTLMDLGVKINQLNLDPPTAFKTTLTALKERRASLKQREQSEKVLLKPRKSYESSHRSFTPPNSPCSPLLLTNPEQGKTFYKLYTAPVYPPMPAPMNREQGLLLIEPPIPHLAIKGEILKQVWKTIIRLNSVASHLHSHEIINGLQQDPSFSLLVEFGMSNCISSVFDRVFFHVGSKGPTYDMLRRSIERTRIELFCVAFIETVDLKGIKETFHQFKRHFQEMHIFDDYSRYYALRLANNEEDEAAKQAILQVLRLLKKEWGC